MHSSAGAVVDRRELVRPLPLAPFFVWVLNVPPLAALPLTFVTATASYYTVERAFLKRRTASAPVGPALTPARA